MLNIPMFGKAKGYRKVFYDLADDSYILNNDYDLCGVYIRPKLVELEDDVALEKIKNVIV